MAVNTQRRPATMAGPLAALLLTTATAGAQEANPATANTPPESAESPATPIGHIVSRSHPGMGTRLQVLIYLDGPSQPASDAKAGAAADAAFEEMTRVEQVMSEWIAGSDVSRINRAAGEQEPVIVAPELFGLLSRGKAISARSGGAFSMSWAALSSLWLFDTGSTSQLPTPAAAQARAKLVDDTELLLDSATSSARLGRKGMSLGLGGIAKGYAVDRAIEVLVARGMPNVLVFAGGDIRAHGSKGETPWLVGVQDPRGPGYFATLPVKDEAVLTSGDYERYFELDGKRYHHILDPKTGYPAAGTRSVTVVTQSAETADALATALFVLGPQAGIKFIEASPDAEALIVTATNEVIMSTGLSDRIHIHRNPHRQPE